MDLEKALTTKRLDAWVAGIALLALAAAGRAGVTWHVDDDAAPGGDGAAWVSAFAELRQATLVAAAGDEIRVAGGRYTPDWDPVSGGHNGDRAATFLIADGVQVLGSYAGLAALKEGDPDARNFLLYASVLSGDLAGDDGPNFNNTQENSYHVVTVLGAGSGTLLDGLTISGGRADGGGEDSGGAGLRASGASLAISSCLFQDNLAAIEGGGASFANGSVATLTACGFAGNRSLDGGGAIFCSQSPVSVRDSLFEGNSAVRYGGAMSLTDRSDAQVIGSNFFDNSAAGWAGARGGAVLIEASSPAFVGCFLLGSVAAFGEGGAIYSYPGEPVPGPTAPFIFQCVFATNSAATGGAVFNKDTDAVIVECSFTSNDASTGAGGGGVWNAGGRPVVMGCNFTHNVGFNGGALYNGAHAEPLIADCVFTLNSAINDNGGGISNVETDAVITGCQFIGNTATGVDFVVGGGASNYLSEPVFVDCVFTQNWADFGGGGMYNENGGQGGPTVLRCSFWANIAPWGGGMFNFLSSPAVRSCLFGFNESPGGWGGGMFNDFDSSPDIFGCTFVANSALAGGGLNCSNEVGSPVVSNSILWGNAPDQIADDRLTPSIVSHCDIQGGWNGPGAGNIDADPSFVSPQSGDYRLQAGSACIDAGDPDAVVEPGESDLTGLPRSIDGDLDGVAVVDIGAFERAPPCPDLDGDGIIALADLLLLLAAWGESVSPADLDGDGTVGAGDVVILTNAWGTCPSP